jgi:hypothetical protein
MKTATVVTLALAALAGPDAAANAVAVAPLSPEARAAMTGKSCKKGCPVSLDDLAAVEVRFIGAGHTPGPSWSQAELAPGHL